MEKLAHSAASSKKKGYDEEIAFKLVEFQGIFSIFCLFVFSLTTHKKYYLPRHMRKNMKIIKISKEFPPSLKPNNPFIFPSFISSNSS